jgi:hypothetical protein
MGDRHIAALAGALAVANGLTHHDTQSAVGAPHLEMPRVITSIGGHNAGATRPLIIKGQVGIC